jgi:hypothetical protein
VGNALDPQERRGKPEDRSDLEASGTAQRTTRGDGMLGRGAWGGGMRESKEEVGTTRSERAGVTCCRSR